MRQPRAVLTLPALLVLTACQSLSVHGGTSVSQEVASSLSSRVTYRPLRCEDARGHVVRGWEAERLELVRSGERELLLVRRPGQEAWLIEPAFREGDEQVYQLSLEGPEGLWLLRDVRLGPEQGRMAFADHWSEERGPGGLRAHFARALLGCELARSTAEER